MSMLKKPARIASWARSRNGLDLGLGRFGVSLGAAWKWSPWMKTGPW